MGIPKKDFIALSAALNMAAFLDRGTTSGAAFNDCADRAFRSAGALYEFLDKNAPGSVEADVAARLDTERLNELHDARALLREAQSELRSLRRELADRTGLTPHGVPSVVSASSPAVPNTGDANAPRDSEGKLVPPAPKKAGS